MSTKAGMLARCPVCGNEYGSGENPQMFKAVLRFPHLTAKVNTLKAQRDSLLDACKWLVQLEDDPTVKALTERYDTFRASFADAKEAIAAVEKEGK